LLLNSCYFDFVTDSEPGCSRKKILRSSNNAELDGITEETELNSKINSDSSASNKVSKQFAKKKTNTEINMDTIVSDLHEARIKAEENVILEFDKENHNPETNQEEVTENSEKRIKTENNKKTFDSKAQDKKASDAVERCQYCKQKLNKDIKLYQGHPNGAIEEQIALTDPKLCLFIGDESFIGERNETTK